jgi:hypothetical protein
VTKRAGLTPPGGRVPQFATQARTGCLLPGCKRSGTSESPAPSSSWHLATESGCQSSAASGAGLRFATDLSDRWLVSRRSQCARSERAESRARVPLSMQLGSAGPPSSAPPTRESDDVCTLSDVGPRQIQRRQIRARSMLFWDCLLKRSKHDRAFEPLLWRLGSSGLTEPTIGFRRTRSSASDQADDRMRGKAITRPGRVARVLAVETDHADTAAVAAGSGGPSRTVDDGRGLQNCIERAPSASAQPRLVSVDLESADVARRTSKAQVGAGSWRSGPDARRVAIAMVGSTRSARFPQLSTSHRERRRETSGRADAPC